MTQKTHEGPYVCNEHADRDGHLKASRRTAGTESGTSDDFNGSDNPHWKCPACGENNNSYGDKCNGCGERTRKESSHHTADRQDDRATTYHKWATKNGHNPDDLATLKLYEKLPGISRAHADEVADLYHGEDTDWRATHRMQLKSSRRTAEHTGPTIDAPEGYAYTPAPEHVQRAMRRRFEDSGTTAIHPDKPEHYLHGINNWWDGPHEVKGESDGTFSFTNPYNKHTDRFDEGGYYHSQTGEHVPWSHSASRRTAQEGIAPATHAPNPNYFSQGTNGLQGPPTFPQDPAEEPRSDTLINDMYGAVPPEESTGSQEGTIDGAGYSRMGMLVHEGDYHYVHKQGDQWVITQKGTGKVLSHHDTEEDAKASFRAMMQSKHSGSRQDFRKSAEERTGSSYDWTPAETPDSHHQRGFYDARTGRPTPGRSTRTTRMPAPTGKGGTPGTRTTVRSTPPPPIRPTATTATARARSAGRTRAASATVRTAAAAARSPGNGPPSTTASRPPTARSSGTATIAASRSGGTTARAATWSTCTTAPTSATTAVTPTPRRCSSSTRPGSPSSPRPRWRSSRSGHQHPRRLRPRPHHLDRRPTCPPRRQQPVVPTRRNSPATAFRPFPPHLPHIHHISRQKLYRRSPPPRPRTRPADRRMSTRPTRGRG